MNDPQTGRQVAQPAEEEIKKHGDQLQKPVDEAAGKQPPDRQANQQPQAGAGPA